MAARKIRRYYARFPAIGFAKLPTQAHMTGAVFDAPGITMVDNEIIVEPPDGDNCEIC